MKPLVCVFDHPDESLEGYLYEGGEEVKKSMSAFVCRNTSCKRMY